MAYSVVGWNWLILDYDKLFRYGPVRAEYLFLVRSGMEQKITGHYGVGVPKTLPRRTLIETFNHALVGQVNSFIAIKYQGMCVMAKFFSEFEGT